MSKLTTAAAAAQLAYTTGPGRLNGVIGVYDADGRFLGGNNRGQWVEERYAAQNNHHVEALLLKSMEAAFGGNIPRGSTVYLYCHYSPCQQCFEDLKECPVVHKGVRWKLGFHTYYATPRVHSGEGLWPDTPAACRAIYRLIWHGWSVRQLAFAGNAVTKPEQPLRFMRLLDHARADVKEDFLTEPKDKRLALYGSLLTEFVNQTLKQ